MLLTSISENVSVVTNKNHSIYRCVPVKASLPLFKHECNRHKIKQISPFLLNSKYHLPSKCHPVWWHGVAADGSDTYIKKVPFSASHSCLHEQPERFVRQVKKTLAGH